MTDRRQAGTVVILRETATEAREAPEVPEKGGNRRILARIDGFRMLIRVHQVYMPDFSSLLTFLADLPRTCSPGRLYNYDVPGAAEVWPGRRHHFHRPGKSW